MLTSRPSDSLGSSFLGRCRFGGRATVLLELIMQGFQADAENLGCPGFIVAGGFKSFQYEQFLCLSHCGAHSETYGVRIVDRGPDRRQPKPWRQMLSFDH